MEKMEGCLRNVQYGNFFWYLVKLGRYSVLWLDLSRVFL